MKKLSLLLIIWRNCFNEFHSNITIKKMKSQEYIEYKRKRKSRENTRI